MVAELCAGYTDSLVLRGLGFNVGASEAAAIVGSNGSGKSTLLRAISGLVSWSGRIEYGGVSLGGMPTEEIAALGIAHVPEGRGTFSSLTVEQNLLLGANRLSRRDAKTGVELVFSILPALAPRRRQTAGTLSGGEQQMLALGRALISNPRLVLLDEPTLGLAPASIDQLFEILERVRREVGCAFLLVEQNLGLVSRFADNVHLLDNGTIVLSARSTDPRLAEALLKATSLAR
jgi:branched-chain amino acid transport system ATP-binding protein